MLAAYLTLVDQHCLNLILVPASDSVPAIPGHIDNRAVYNSWAGEYVVDYEAWVNNFPSRPYDSSSWFIDPKLNLKIIKHPLFMIDGRPLKSKRT